MRRPPDPAASTAGAVTGPDGPEGAALSLLPVVSDPVRWRILTLLADEQLCTTHLQELLGAKQALVSHHLRVLRESGVLDTEPCGRFTYYRLRPGVLDGLASAFAALAEATHRQPSRRAC